MNDQRRNTERGLCDIGDCDREHEWSLLIQTTVPGRVAWNGARVCTEHVERVQEMQAMFSRGDRSYLKPVAEFDHDTRGWVPTSEGDAS